MTNFKSEKRLACQEDLNSIKKIDEMILDPETEVNKLSKKFTCHQLLALITLAILDFMSFCGMSIMAPFFPQEAHEKGMSDLVSGIVFGFYALVVFLTAPIFGRMIPTTGEKFIFVFGVILSAICNIAFGMLEYIADYTTFTILCFCIRGFEALGSSAYSTASYVLVANIFPNNVGSVRGILEVFVGVGMSAGPTIGAFLFLIGGFSLPFYTIGAIILIVAPISYYLLPSSGKQNYGSGSFIDILQIPTVLLTISIIIVVSINWSFLDPILEPHLRQFDITTTEVGFLFLLLTITYACTCPLWGWISDKINNTWSLMASGLLLSIIALLIVGPSPLLPFLESSVFVTTIGLGLLGLSIALSLLPTFDGILINAVDAGIQDNIVTQGLVSGLWSSAYSFGEMIGPTCSGVLTHYYGFPITVTIVAVINLIVFIICVVYIFKQRRIRKRNGIILGEVSIGSWKKLSENDI